QRVWLGSSNMTVVSSSRIAGARCSAVHGLEAGRRLSLAYRFRRANEPELCASGIRARCPGRRLVHGDQRGSRLHQSEPPCQVAGLLATQYTAPQMTYDLRPLRGKCLIQRLPHSNTYLLTTDGIRVAIFYTNVYERLLRPLLAVDHPPELPELR